MSPGAGRRPDLALPPHRTPAGLRPCTTASQPTRATAATCVLSARRLSASGIGWGMARGAPGATKSRGFTKYRKSKLLQGLVESLEHRAELVWAVESSIGQNTLELRASPVCQSSWGLTPLTKCARLLGTRATSLVHFNWRSSMTSPSPESLDDAPQGRTLIFADLGLLLSRILAGLTGG